MSDLQPLGRFAWERVVKRCKMPRSTKLVAFTLATFADRDGSNVRPGEEQLAADLDGMSERQVRRHMARLRDDYRLIERVSRGGSRSRFPDVYRLVLPDDLADRLEFNEDPELRRERHLAAVDKAAVSVDNSVDNVSEDDLNGVELRTSGAGTPDIHGPNSGHIDVLPPCRPPIDQYTNTSGHFGAVEGARASTDKKTDQGLSYPEALKIIQPIIGEIDTFAAAIQRDAEDHGLDPPHGQELTIAVAKIALVKYPHLLPDRRTA
jgi:hypothetical protein